jgi:hypothetical protein
MRRYRRVIHRQLDSIVYNRWDDPTLPLADLGELAEMVRAEIMFTDGGRGTSTRNEGSLRSSNPSSQTAALHSRRFAAGWELVHDTSITTIAMATSSGS